MKDCSAGIRVKVDRSTMLLDNLVTHCKSHSQPIVSRGEIRIKNSRSKVVGDAAAGIRDLDVHSTVTAANGYRQLATALHFT